jgi:hypothetical protein
LKSEVVLFADFTLKVIGKIWPKHKAKNDKLEYHRQGEVGQWLMSCTGRSFSKKETRYEPFYDC